MFFLALLVACAIMLAVTAPLLFLIWQVLLYAAKQ